MPRLRRSCSASGGLSPSILRPSLSIRASTFAIRSPAVASIGLPASFPGPEGSAASACQARSAARKRLPRRPRASFARSRSRRAREQRPQRLELGRADVADVRGQLRPLEQLDVEVAHRAGQRLRPLQLVAHVRAGLRVVHVLELAQDGARAADRDAQVVQELGVEVLERPREVRLRDLVQAAEHERGRGVGAGAARAARP